MSRPKIGLTTYRQRGQTGVWDTEMAMIPAFYIEGVTRAGGTAILIPPQQLDSEDAKAVVASLDGLVICGGRDIDANRYGQTPHEKAEEPDRLRDALENAILEAAIEAQLPFLGICRGAQMLNVHRGGSLIQHLPEVVGDNRYQKGGGVFTDMDIDVLEGSLLESVTGTKVTNAALYHHQAIDSVGDGLRVSAVSPDGIVEAIELDDYPFGLAVQWHPEQTLGNLELFEALVSAAKTYRGAK